jgi:hypothetical protein
MSTSCRRLARTANPRWQMLSHANVCRFCFHGHGRKPKCKKQDTRFRNFHFLQSQVNGVLSLISDWSVLSVDFDSDTIALHCGCACTGVADDVLLCSSKMCHALLEIWGHQCSCFSRKLILARPVHHSPSQIASFRLFANHNSTPLLFFSQHPSVSASSFIESGNT